MDPKKQVDTCKNLLAHCGVENLRLCKIIGEYEDGPGIRMLRESYQVQLMDCFGTEESQGL